jgi:hypothetical protein
MDGPGTDPADRARHATRAPDPLGPRHRLGRRPDLPRRSSAPADSPPRPSAGRSGWRAAFVVLLVLVEMARWFAPKRKGRKPSQRGCLAALLTRPLARGAPAVLAVHPAGPLRPGRHRRPRHPHDHGAALRARLRAVRAADRVRLAGAAVRRDGSGASASARAFAAAWSPASAPSVGALAADLHRLRAAGLRGRRDRTNASAQRSNAAPSTSPTRSTARGLVEGSLAALTERRDGDPRHHGPLEAPPPEAPLESRLRTCVEQASPPPPAASPPSSRPRAGWSPTAAPTTTPPTPSPTAPCSRSAIEHAREAVTATSTATSGQSVKKNYCKDHGRNPAGPVQLARHPRRPLRRRPPIRLPRPDRRGHRPPGPPLPPRASATATSSCATSRARPPSRSPRRLT